MTDFQLAIIVIHLVIIECFVFFGPLFIVKTIETYCKKEKPEKPHKFYICEKGYYDLTLMFGEGNEPTAKEFEKMMLNNYEYEKENKDE